MTTETYCREHEREYPCGACPPVRRSNVPLECGEHFVAAESRRGGECYKCRTRSDMRRRGLLQYGGTPWAAIIGEVVKSQ